MATTPVCSCDSTAAAPITNLPGQPQIAYRAGDFNSFRTALLTPLLAPEGQPPLEQSLTAWQSGVGADPSVVDLAVMMVEWWAYLGDILTFYNERISNEDYLRTAIQPDTPGALVRLLGYRPRPAIGATGNLAALLTPSILPGQTVTLPAGLQFQSKPGPGQSPQTYELLTKTILSQPDHVPATTQPFLVTSAGNQLLLQGTVTTLSNGNLLLLDLRSDAAQPALITLSAAPQPVTSASGVKQTLLTFSGAAPSPISAETGRLRKSTQTASLWTVNGTNVSSGTTVQLASVVRQIRPNDWVVFTGPNGATQVVQVASVADVMGDAESVANGGGPTSVGTKAPLPILHTQLTLQSNLSSALAADSAPQNVTLLYGWVEAAALVDQPPAAWDGTTALIPIQPAAFPPASVTTVPSPPILIQDSVGVGLQATGDVASGDLDVDLPTSNPAPLATTLQPPLNVYYNLLPITQGKTVANEVLGSGDGTQAGQSFTLSKSPVTYLMNGAVYASTIALTVNGQPWTEVASFYGQPPGAQVFTTREDATQMTHVDFGDGINGARLPTGTNNVVATYRVGAGAASPPAGKLTTIAQSYPGLRSVVNPVPVSGGSDPDPAALLQKLAPQSVLTFGRAVSVFDYQALAAGAPGVTQASAIWSWDDENQTSGVTVYVTGEPNVAASVQTLLSQSGDPNRPVQVLTATQISISLTLTLIVTTGMDTTAIQTAVTTALCDPSVGLFAPAQSGIGQGVFNSVIESASLAVTGVVATKGLIFTIDQIPDSGPLHMPGEGAYFSLTAASFFPTLTSQEVSGNGNS